MFIATFKKINWLMLSVIMLLLSINQCFAQESSVDMSKVIKSKILGSDVHYSVYLPPDYNSSNRSYPIFYFLHGGGDGIHSDIYFQGNLKFYLDSMIKSGEITPMIVVTPDATRNGDIEHNTYYMNDADGKYLYEDMFIKEFIPQIEKTYRVNSLTKFRAVGGYSMGGFAALYYTLQYPDLFKATAALSGAFRTEEQVIDMDMDGYNTRYGKAFGLNLEGKNRINSHFDHYDVLKLSKNIPASIIKNSHFYIDCGSKDSFFIGNALLNLNLRKNNANYIFMVRDGGHYWNYWTSGFHDMLRFVGERLQDFE